MTQLIRLLTLALLSLRFTCNVHAFELNAASIPVVSLAYKNHLIWTEAQHPFYKDYRLQNNVNFPLITSGYGYQYHHNQTNYYCYSYADLFAKHSGFKNYGILNLGLGISKKKWSIGFNSYASLARVFFNNSLLRQDILKANTHPEEMQRAGVDGYLTIPFSQFTTYLPYTNGYIGAFYHQIEKRLTGTGYRPYPYRPYPVGHFTKNTSMVGIAVGIEFWLFSLQASYDNLHGKRILLNIYPIPISFNFNSSCNIPRIRRHIGPFVPYKGETQRFKDMDLRQYIPHDRASAAIKAQVILNPWAANTLSLSPQPSTFDKVVASSFVRLEKNSRIMLYQLANAQSKPHLPEEIRLQIGNDIIANDIFKPSPLLDDASAILFPYIQTIPQGYRESNIALRSITEALFAHYRYLRQKKLKN